jgi:hypothetical protein
MSAVSEIVINGNVFRYVDMNIPFIASFVEKLVPEHMHKMEDGDIYISNEAYMVLIREQILNLKKSGIIKIPKEQI